MQIKDFYVDFHCHTTLRAMNSTPLNKTKNLWEKTHNSNFNNPIGRWARLQTREIAKESQSNLYDYAESKTRVIFDSLYPVEKGWYRFRKLPSFLVGERSKEILMHVAFGIEHQRMCKLRSSDGYFKELEESYNFLVYGQGNSPNGSNRYKVVRNYNELEKVLSKDDKTIAIIISVEGAHALECGAPCTENISQAKHKELISSNIEIIKNWDYPIFSMNLAHHFYNQLCGHARSMKSPVSLMFTQDVGINEGITDLGWFVIQKLLDNRTGKRIFIDTKHMSVNARMQYYNYITVWNKLNPEDKIPLICSHGAVNGFETMKESAMQPDVMRKFKGKYFNTWSINLSDEEINLFHDNEGIIGIMMDKSLLGSPETLKMIKTISDPVEKKNSFIKLFLDNIFHIVKVTGKKTGWDCIAAGSDYDGIITHLDNYHNAASLGEFRKDIVYYLETYQYKNDLWFGYSPWELTEKIFRENAFRFLQKFF